MTFNFISIDKFYELSLDEAMKYKEDLIQYEKDYFEIYNEKIDVVSIYPFIIFEYEKENKI